MCVEIGLVFCFVFTLSHNLQGLIVMISSEPTFIEVHVRFTTGPLKASIKYELFIQVLNLKNSILNLRKSCLYIFAAGEE